MICFDTNLKGHATTQFMDFDFNSLVKFAGKYRAASAAGLFTLGGDSDDGADIDASFELPGVPVTAAWARAWRAAAGSWPAGRR